MAKQKTEDEGMANQTHEEEADENDKEEGLSRRKSLRRRLKRWSSYAGLMQTLRTC